MARLKCGEGHTIVQYCKKKAAPKPPKVRKERIKKAPKAPKLARLASKHNALSRVIAQKHANQKNLDHLAEQPFFGGKARERVPLIDLNKEMARRRDANHAKFYASRAGNWGGK